MKKIFMPKGAKNIIDKLYESGREAYIVGGCVRDALLSKIADDYDITTNASPDEIKAIFHKTIDTGIAHGTVTVISDGAHYEVTTYRIDGEYSDMRHPESVTYTESLRDDLSRRDFTVNAMAYNERAGLVDEFGGIGDLNSRIIRTVGDPEKRFTEDALRVLRGIRFSSVLDFDIEKSTSDAIKRLAPNLTRVSAERIYAEFKKLLSGKRAYDVIYDYFDVIKVFIPELKILKLPEKEKFNSLTPTEKMISLFVYNGRSDAFLSMSKRLKTDTKTRDTGISVLNNLIEDLSIADKGIRRFLISAADEAAIAASRISEAFGLCPAGVSRKVEKFIELDAPRRISQLKVDGKDIMSLGFKGRAVGELLGELIRLVAEEQLPNEKQELLSYVLKFKKT